MKCNSCSTTMVLDRTESSSVSRSEWYQCPFCLKVRMTTSKTTIHGHEQAARELAHEQIHGFGELREQPQLQHGLSSGNSFALESNRDPHSGQPEPMPHPEFEF